MNYVTKAITSVQTFYKEMNPSTLSGAIDVIVVRHPNGELRASPFHVRFGKLKLLRPKLNRVNITVNGRPVDIHMKIGDAGEAFFVVETDSLAPDDIVTSPIQTPMDSSAKEDVMEFLDLNAEAPEKVVEKVKVETKVMFEKEVIGRHQTSSETSQLSILEGLRVMSVDDDSEHVSAGQVKEIVIQTEKRLADLQQQQQQQNLHSPQPLSSKPSLEIDVKKASRRLAKQASLSDIEFSDGEDAYGSSPGQNWSWGWGRLPVEDSKNQKSATPSVSSMQNFQASVNQAAQKGFELDIPDDFLPEESSKEGAEGRGKGEYDVEFSLCGEFFQQDIITPWEAEECLDIFYKYEINFDDFWFNPIVISDPNLIVRINGRMYRAPVALPFMLSLLAYHKPPPKQAMKNLIKQHWKDRAQVRNKANGGGGGWKSWFRRGGGGGEKEAAAASQTITPSAAAPVPATIASAGTTPSPQSSPVLSPSPFPGAEPHPTNGTTSLASSGATGSSPPSVHNYVKSVRLSDEQLKSLELKDGANVITFEVEGKVCTGQIYLWNHDDKVVISDIDGTITKSDTLGHIFTAVGKDWTHSGVANLFTNIAANGYKIVYVTSRAIGQSGYTKEFLRWVEQTGGWRLPDGPCLCAPDRLLVAFHREIIQRKPQEFKIAVLQDVCSLFGHSPFYAGFGNRITDSISYRAVGVPVHRIFTINPQGDIKGEMINTFKSTYLGLNEIVNQMFPPVNKTNEIKEEFNDFNYWKSDLPQVELDLGELDEEENDKKGSTGGYPFYDLGK